MSDTTCKGCGRKVLFATDEHGKTQILDAAAPIYALTTTPDAPDRRVVRVPRSYVSHFSTCPKAGTFSKKMQARRKP